MPLSQAESYLDHLSSCSPCYRDFARLQADYRQRRARMIFAVAASVLIVVGLSTWAMLRHHDWQMARAVVDLRERSIARGTEPPPTEPPLEIPRTVSHLEIYLPLGSSDGPYDVRIAAATGNPLYTGSGVAHVRAGITLLPIDIDLASANLGLYVLEIRKAGSEWNSYPLRIQ
jgi:hypothetical protein